MSHSGSKSAASSPKTANSRVVAAKIIASILNNHGSLSTLFSGNELHTLSPVDRAFSKELCFGVMRHYFQLENIADQLLKKPLREKDYDIYALLLIGTYQILHMRTADHAAVSETVNATKILKKKWATGLVNASLRNLLRNTSKMVSRANNSEEARYNFPQWLIESFKKSWPQDWEQIISASNQRAPMVLRINKRLTSIEEYGKLLEQEEIDSQPHPIATDGIVLSKPVPVTTLPGFDDGLVSVQDGAAQLTAELLKIEPEMRVLDCCAAPGGKTCHILERYDIDLIAIELDPARADMIEENLERLGLGAQVITADACAKDEWWDSRKFERILLDTPCSGTGVIRRHPDIKVLRTQNEINQLQQLQIKLLDSMWELLADNGILIYATCSVLPQENSMLIKQWLKTRRDAKHIPIDASWGKPQEYGRQILPGDSANMDDSHSGAGMDGFFYAKICKHN
ncbi:MAG: 16S rRNA (cytosine(967)-C(5))-methyltransferase RsmB [Gammaproteobacteria bacterium]|nr:MAG: 16S rRNA (cytosine(967)-C(5))-methyltransferase RsmB [Gammaproteobacteria bacterium]